MATPTTPIEDLKAIMAVVTDLPCRKHETMDRCEVDKLVTQLTALVKRGYQKGYNSGWVRATRITRPDHLEYYASQLEAAAESTRKALEALEPPKDSSPHQHEYTIDLGDPCSCGSDNCYACVCGDETHD